MCLARYMLLIAKMTVILFDQLLRLTCMQFKSSTTCFIMSCLCLFSLFFVSPSSHAKLIAEYDLRYADGTSSLKATYVDSNYLVSDVIANGVWSQPTPWQTNHFEFSGWDDSINLNKYYSVSLSSETAFELSMVEFSMEMEGRYGDYYLRSSLDGFSSNIATGSLGHPGNNNQLDTFFVDLSILDITTDIEFRWYITTAYYGTDIGFVNYDCNIEDPRFDGVSLEDVGCDFGVFESLSEYDSQVLGLNATGVDLRFYDNIKVSEPWTFVLFVLGLGGIVSSRKVL